MKYPFAMKWEILIYMCTRVYICVSQFLYILLFVIDQMKPGKLKKKHSFTTNSDALVTCVDWCTGENGRYMHVVGGSDNVLTYSNTVQKW